MDEFDYIVVGAGSAGCALAGRLSSNPAHRVLLLEAGGPPSSIWIKIPAGLPRVLQRGKWSWNTPSTVGSRSDYLALHGKTLGGSSAINGMVYMRGYPTDFNRWSQRGIKGWDWETVLQSYRALECHEDGESPIHGGAGGLKVSRLAVRHPTTDAFIDAAVKLGLRRTDDLNDGIESESVGRIQVTIGNGVRCSSYDAFIRPHLHRSNLTIVTHALGRRILFEGKKAVGFEYEVDGQIQSVKGKQVILSAGAINSPHLLLLSGIGPANQLKANGIDVVHDLPAVGQNFHDHAYLWCTAQVKSGASMNRGLQMPHVISHALRYMFTRKGPLAAGGSQAAALLRSSPLSATPDLQVSFRPFTVIGDARGRTVIAPGNGVTLMPNLELPYSRGSVSLRSPDAHVRPHVDFNMLGDTRDEDALLVGLRWVLQCLNSGPFKGLVTGPTTPDLGADDATLRDFMRATVFPGAHMAGSCAMGYGNDAVVDDHFSVHGVQGVSVCDASIMPDVICGNTNGPSIMIGYRGGDLIPKAMERSRHA